jgi:4-hydroxymandelate oxidase
MRHSPERRDDTIPPGVVALADYEAHARQVLSPEAWAYFSGGAADELTLRANRSAWDALPLHPRVLRPMAGSHTRVDLLGRTLAHPILLAPIAYQRLLHPGGEVASALAATALQAGVVLGTLASMPMEDVAQTVLGDPLRGPLWFQLYLQRDRGATRALVQRAEQAGFEALVLTVDAAVHGARDRERRAGFSLPPGVHAVNLTPPAAPIARDCQGAHQGLCAGLADEAPTWADVEWLQQNTRLPVLLKGVTHPDDAVQAAAMGVAGLVVSNHGGRTLDTVPATAWLLPRIADATGGHLPLLVDGGIRRGTDVLKAMALGASAVLVGRPYAWGLATAGAQGVAHVLRLLRDELEIAMVLSGVATLQDATRRLVLP